MVVEFCESNKSVDGIAVDAGPFVPGSTLDCFTDVSRKVEFFLLWFEMVWAMIVIKPNFLCLCLCYMEFLDVWCEACWWVFLCDWLGLGRVHV